MRQIVGRIWKYVLIGVGVGALMHGYVPADLIARIAGDGSVAVSLLPRFARGAYIGMRGRASRAASSGRIHLA